MLSLICILSPNTYYLLLCQLKIPAAEQKPIKEICVSVYVCDIKIAFGGKAALKHFLRQHAQLCFAILMPRTINMNYSQDTDWNTLSWEHMKPPYRQSPHSHPWIDQMESSSPALRQGTFPDKLEKPKILGTSACKTCMFSLCSLQMCSPMHMYWTYELVLY